MHNDDAMIPHIPAAPCRGEKSNTSEVNAEGASFEFRRLSWVALFFFPLTLSVKCGWKVLTRCFCLFRAPH